jgi:hypothetical protein
MVRKNSNRKKQECKEKLIKVCTVIPTSTAGIEVTSVYHCTSMTLYRNRLSQDDIEFGKIRYHRSHIFADLFCKSAHHMANRCLHNALGTVQNYLFATREVPNGTFHRIEIPVWNFPGCK